MAAHSLKSINTHKIEIDQYPKVSLSVDCVIFGFQEGALKVLLIRSDLDEYKNKWTLLGDLVRETESLDKAAYRVLRSRTGLNNVFLEQVHTFGAPGRHPAGRVVTTAYYALVNIDQCRIVLHEHELHWHPVRHLRNLAFDHKKIFDTSLQRLRQALIEQHVGFNLLGEKFSLRQLQDVYEAVLGTPMDRRNFRKKMMASDLINDTGEIETDVSHRPGKLYKRRPLPLNLF